MAFLVQVAIFLKVANSPKHDGFVPDRSTASFIVNLHTLQIFADRSDLLQVEQPCQSSDITPTLAIATRQSSCRASQYRCRSIGHVPSSGPPSFIALPGHRYLVHRASYSRCRSLNSVLCQLVEVPDMPSNLAIQVAVQSNQVVETRQYRCLGNSVPRRFS